MSSDHEHEDDREINVLDDTDSRLSHTDSEPRSSRSRCSSPENVSSSNAALPFSISNLLGKNFDQKQDESEMGGLYSSPTSGLFQHHQRSALSLMPAGFYGQGVLRVPAHRPLGGPGSPPNNAAALFSPWSLGLDPVLQRSAAAAAFASQVVKDRLAGKGSVFLSMDGFQRCPEESHSSKRFRSTWQLK
nr:unnamed protein product [Callosobruchus analis]